MAKKNRAKKTLAEYGEGYRELFAAVGDAITCWAAVEDGLFIVFVGVLRVQETDAASAAFHSLSSFAPKLDMVHAAVVQVVKEPALTQWMKLHERLVAGNRQRNRVAHLPAWWIDGRAVLSPSFLNVRRTTRPKLAASEVLGYARDYMQLFEELQDFAYGSLPKPPKYLRLASET